MRILLLNYECPPLGGGGGVAAWKLAAGWAAAGHSVDYVTTWFRGLARSERLDGVDVHRVTVLGRRDLATATMASLVSFPVPAYRKALELAGSRRYDWINSHFAVPTGPAGVWAADRLKIPHILSLHGGDIYDPSKRTSPHRHWYYRSVVRWVLGRADRVVAQSRNTRDNALRYYGFTGPVEIIPLPYTPIAFEPVDRTALGLDPQKKYLVAVGRLVRRKDYATLIRALARLDDPAVDLLLIGEGPERDALGRLAAQLGVADRVRFPGFVAEEKKFQYLQNADLYVLSSLHEGFGIVLQEAMQVGLPIVATNHGGQTDLVEDGVNGFLVEVGDAAGMAAKIAALLADPAARRAIAARNRLRVEDFSAERICRDYLELLP